MFSYHPPEDYKQLLIYHHRVEIYKAGRMTKVEYLENIFDYSYNYLADTVTIRYNKIIKNSHGTYYSRLTFEQIDEVIDRRGERL